MNMSLRKYAAHRGISLTAVQKALQAGRITLDPKGGIDPQKADADWKRNTRHAQPTPLVANTPDYHKARAVKEFYAARLAKLEVERREATLVSIDEINVQHFRRTRILRERMFRIPRALAAQVAAETDPRTVEEMLESAICEALEELSGIKRE